jgi:hypothetical protein
MSENMRDAYEGAREDLLTWKKRALKAEAALWKLKQDTMAFVVIGAAEVARQRGLPEGHFLPGHYDLIASLGARMVDFTRAPDAS